MSSIFSLLEGRTLRDRYRIDRLVGKGGMGAVFRATDEQLGREVAVKVISIEPDTPEQEEKLRARFRREARAAARLRHPNVVAIYDVGTNEAPRLDFIVMELLEGEDLHRRVRREGPLPPRTALRLMYEAARGLGAGHRLGLVHRDVKPANLFLERVDDAGKVRARVLDFGIAQVMEETEGTATHLTLFGRGPLSPGYAAPEQLQSQARLTPACDVFGLGVSAFEALTGSLPFTDGDRARMAEGLEVPPPSLLGRVASLSPAVDTVLRRALAARPEDRYADGDAFAEALQAAARPRRSGAPRTRTPPAPSAPPPAPSASAPPPGRVEPFVNRTKTVSAEDRGERWAFPDRPAGTRRVPPSSKTTVTADHARRWLLLSLGIVAVYLYLLVGIVTGERGSGADEAAVVTSDETLLPPDTTMLDPSTTYGTVDSAAYPRAADTTMTP